MNDLNEEEPELRINIMPKKAHSQHLKLMDVKMNKTTKSAHMLGDMLMDSIEVVSGSFVQKNVFRTVQYVALKYDSEVKQIQTDLAPFFFKQLHLGVYFSAFH